MQSLPNNCRMGNMSVHPANWKTTSANASITWRITYWFYDDSLGQKKQIVIKGMNKLKAASERKQLTEILMRDETEQLKAGYNPITNKVVQEEKIELCSEKPFIEALDHALDILPAEHLTKIDIRSCIKYVGIAAEHLKFHVIPIKDIKRKHIRLALETCGKQKETFSDNTYNHYRKYLGLLFRQLIDIEAVEYNPITDLARRKQVRKIRDTLTVEQRKTINGFLKEYHYKFWRFLQIFFHSGARITELLNVSHSQVDLTNQRYKATIKKGKVIKEQWKPIKDVVLYLWKEVLGEANISEYLFSVGLKPGRKVIRREQITRRWKVHVKDKLNVTADFYSLKHTNLDEVAALLNIEEAQKLAGHTTSGTTKIYAIGELDRKDTKLKRVVNSFA